MVLFEDIEKRTHRSLEWDRLKWFLSQQAESGSGSSTCLQLSPHVARTEIEKQLDETNESLAMLQAQSALSCGGLPQLEEILPRLQTGASLNAQELLAVSKMLQISRQLRSSLSLLSDDSFPRLKEYLPELYTLPLVTQALTHAIDEHGKVKDEASNTLQSLRREVQRIEANIKEELLRIIHSSTLSKSLQEPIYTQRSGRYVLPVSASMRGSISGIVHDSSASGLTVFIEPIAVVELANKLRIRETEIDHEINRILNELSALCYQHFEQLKRSFHTCVTLDVIQAKARLAMQYDGHRPTLSDDTFFSFKQVRHPLLVLQSSLADVVPNDVQLGADYRTLVITGPNTGGKTVLLKTVGILSLMLRAGLLPSARSGSTAAIFTSICADIGDEQSIEQNLSTFSSHLTNIVQIINQANRNMLVLLDEIGVGTDPQEGAAIAQSVLEFLNSSGAITIATTHYGELKTLAYTQQGFINGSLEFDQSTLSPSYRLRLGVPGSSKAMDIASRLGLRSSVIERARDLLESGQEELTQTIELLEERLRTTTLREEEANQAVLENRRLQRETEEQLEFFRTQMEAERKQFARAIEDEFKLSRDYVNHLIADLQKQPGLAKAEKTKQEIEKVRKELGWTEPPKTALAKPPQQISVGQEVRVRSLGQIARVEEIPARSELSGDAPVTVRIGNLKVIVPYADLESSTKENRTQTKRASRSKAEAVSERRSHFSGSTGRTRENLAVFVRTQGNTIDLRGQRVESALLAVERFLDECVLHHTNTVMIIHGHGTGAVKNAVREYLSQSSYVQSFRPGATYEGGDGVTLVDLT